MDGRCKRGGGEAGAAIYIMPQQGHARDSIHTHRQYTDLVGPM